MIVDLKKRVGYTLVNEESRSLTDAGCHTRAHVKVDDNLAGNYKIIALKESGVCSSGGCNAIKRDTRFFVIESLDELVNGVRILTVNGLLSYP